MNVTPPSTAARSTASASLSSTEPQSAPNCQAPSPTTPTSRPVRPSFRVSMPPRLGPEVELQLGALPYGEVRGQRLAHDQLAVRLDRSSHRRFRGHGEPDPIGHLEPRIT